MRRRPLIVALILLPALAAPGGALAQSAGDEQYQDPFAETEQAPSGQGGGSGGGQDAQPAPAPAQAPASSAQSEPAPGAPALPRTGFPAALAAAIGLVLLAAGVALRLAVWAPPRNCRGGMLSLSPGALASGRAGAPAGRTRRVAAPRARRRALRR
jgi:hypothetical protein